MSYLRCVMSVLSLSTVAAHGADRFVSAAAGFSMDKPAGWTAVSRPDGGVSAEELDAAIEQKTTVSLVTMTNDALPFSNFQVTLIPRSDALAKASPRQILELLVLPPLQKRSPGFTLAGPVRELELSGHAAAEYVATDTIKTSGLSMPVRIRAILAARGRFFYLIDMFAAADDKSTEEFAKLVSSITFEK